MRLKRKNLCPAFPACGQIVMFGLPACMIQVSATILQIELNKAVVRCGTSSVGTISGLYASMRLLFSRIGQPYVGTASYFYFNDPNGMCKTCSGLGKITKVDIEGILDMDKSWNEGCVKDSLYRMGSWYWKQYAQPGLFDLDKPVWKHSPAEQME